MANIAASTKLGKGFGPGGQDSFKFVCVSFATVATGDALIFDESNVGRENSLSVIRACIVQCASGLIASLNIASNVVSVDPGAFGATQVTAIAFGVGG